ncbi:MFS transporter [Bacillus cereus]|uniref:Major facilitator superfamily (MFS) profile domain-containing protein n=1 Tax=Bacillus cereus MC67 TaxID=1053219 RepID=J8BAE9_BACCE|nr:MFS transporter [Bacillus cereus]EJQ90863.1 hypothetical protein II3_05595 [Bacillus cereus MC67]EOO98684.1 hypothetical protein II1_05509 [Bacillus cereus MC118]
MQTKTNLWTKDFIILSLVNFFLTLIFFLLNVTIALYAVNEFNASTGQAGLVVGSFIIGSLIGRLFTGPIMNKIGQKQILVIGLILFPLTTLLYFIDYGISFLIMSRFLNGITVGIAGTVIGTIVALAVPASRRGEGISYLGSPYHYGKIVRLDTFWTQINQFPVRYRCNQCTRTQNM